MRASNETTFSNEDVLLTRLPKTFDHISNETAKDSASYGQSTHLVGQWRGQTSEEWLRDAARTVGEAALTADLNMQAEIASRRQALLLADILSLLCK